MPTLASHFYTVRKIAAILLICCLFFTLLGYHIIYKVRLSGIKTEMKARLHSRISNEVMTLRFNQADKWKVEWEDGSEILYGKEMYDVIDTSTVGNQFVVHCIHDKKEQELVENYLKLHDDSPSPLQTGLIKLMTTSFLSAAMLQYIPVHYHNQINYPVYTASVANGYFSSPDQPPRTA